MRLSSAAASHHRINAPDMLRLAIRAAMRVSVDLLRFIVAAASDQGLTFVHCSTQRKRLLWDRGCT
jgi:hypothetical protein